MLGTIDRFRTSCPVPLSALSLSLSLAFFGASVEQKTKKGPARMTREGRATSAPKAVGRKRAIGLV